jgi:hypothetical protein
MIVFGTLMITTKHRQTFFQGKAKIFQGARTYFLPKKQQKRYYFSQKKSKNLPSLSGQGGEARSPFHAIKVSNICWGNNKNLLEPKSRSTEPSLTCSNQLVPSQGSQTRGPPMHL